MRTGAVSVVTPFRYTRLIFAIFLATVFLHERPNEWTLIGAALVIGSGLYTLIRSARLKA
jgi:drug/metabolite transporter (DMT)-like permease